MDYDSYFRNPMPGWKEGITSLGFCQRKDLVRKIALHCRPKLEKPFRNMEASQGEFNEVPVVTNQDLVAQKIFNADSNIATQLLSAIDQAWNEAWPDKPHGLITRYFAPDLLRSGVASGITNCRKLIEIVCNSMLVKGSLLLSNFRDHIQAGMTFMDELASLKDQRDSVYLDGGRHSFDVTPQSIKFTSNQTQNEFIEEIKKARSERRGCPMKKIEMEIDLWNNGKKEKVNMIKALYWLVAKQAERELFQQIKPAQTPILDL